MSLDVYLKTPLIVSNPPTRAEQAIKLLEDNGLDEFAFNLKRANERELGDRELFTANITHNLVTMAEAAGIYMHLWRPEEIGIKTAGELMDPLREGYRLLINEPGRFKKLNPSNGWGSYEGLVKFVKNYLAACIENPDAIIEVCR